MLIVPGRRLPFVRIHEKLVRLLTRPCIQHLCILSVSTLLAFSLGCSLFSPKPGVLASIHPPFHVLALQDVPAQQE